MEEKKPKVLEESGQEFKYYAFISYSSKDEKWAKRLHYRLEHYRMPAKLCREKGWRRTPLRPVFFAPTDIQPGGLLEELKKHLHESRNLIVIGSPNSAKSGWVGEEIEIFHKLGRTDHIHYFIIDGEPGSGNPDTDCYHPVIKELGIPEILGANIHELIYKLPWMNRERAYAQLVSKLLGVEFDSIWQRHKRQFIRRIIAWVLGALAVLAILGWVWLANQPFDARVTLNETPVHNDELPTMSNGLLTLMLDNEAKVDTIKCLGGDAVFNNLPHRYLGKQVRIKLAAQDFLPVDTVVKLERNVAINVQRDSMVYGKVEFGLWNSDLEKYLPNTVVEVNGRRVTSDSKGRISLYIPLVEQRRSYIVKVPSFNLDYTLLMPCGGSDVIDIAQ